MRKFLPFRHPTIKTWDFARIEKSKMFRIFKLQHSFSISFYTVKRIYLYCWVENFLTSYITFIRNLLVFWVFALQTQRILWSNDDLRHLIGLRDRAKQKFIDSNWIPIPFFYRFYLNVHIKTLQIRKLTMPFQDAITMYQFCHLLSLYVCERTILKWNALGSAHWKPNLLIPEHLKRKEMFNELRDVSYSNVLLNSKDWINWTNCLKITTL